MLKEIVLAASLVLGGCASKKIEGVWVDIEPFPDRVTEDGVRVTKGLYHYVHFGKFDFDGDEIEDHVIFFHTPYHDKNTLNVMHY